MKKIISVILSLILITVSFSACSNSAILKGKNFSDDYRKFLKNMKKQNPVSVEYELYSVNEGFNKDNLIIDTDKSHISELVNALADVEIVGKVSNASNFSVKHYTFTDKNGKRFTFNFYGEYLKVGKTFYQTENYTPFINIRLNEKKSGNIYLALDCIYNGSNKEKDVVYIGAKELDVSSGKVKYGAFNDYKVSEKIKIISPISSKSYNKSVEISLDDFFKKFGSIKGEENSAFIFKATLEDDVLTSLTYDYELSSTTPIRY